MALLKYIDFEYGRFTKDELKALDAFEQFSKYVPEIYTKNIATPYGTFFDVASTNITGGTELVELKFRYGTGYGDCFIELEKWNNLMHAWRSYNNMPIYINFNNTWKDVHVWYLPGIKTDPTFHKDVKIKTRDGNHFIADRLGLAWDNAYHYVWNEERQAYDITKPNEQKPIEEKAVHYNVNNNPKTRQYFNINVYHYVWNEERQAYDITKPNEQKPIEEKAVYYHDNNNPKTRKYFNIDE